MFEEMRIEGVETPRNRYSVRFDVRDPHVLFDGNRTLKLTARDGLFLSSSPAMDPIKGSSKAELHAHLSSITGVDVRKYPTNRPVTAEQLHLRTDHVFTDRVPPC